MKNHSLFNREKEIIAHNKKTVEKYESDDNPLYSEYLQLSDHYAKLFKQFSRIVKISDKTQEQLKESRESIIKYNDELKQLNATKDKFFSIIAHDLKSPFQAFLNLNTFLVKRLDAFSREEITELITELGDVADNLFKLLENLLSWSRIQMGKTQFSPNVFPVNQLVDMTLEVLTIAAENKNIELVKNLDDNITVFTDPNMFNTILRNLVSNAIKFTPKNGKIAVAANRDNTSTVISVSDNGIGLSNEDQTKLFRLDLNHSTPGTEEEKGTGLGLILCKEMIDKHDGKIWVESEKNVGTSFYFSLHSTSPS